MLRQRGGGAAAIWRCPETTVSESADVWHSEWLVSMVALVSMDQLIAPAHSPREERGMFVVPLVCQFMARQSG